MRLVVTGFLVGLWGAAPLAAQTLPSVSVIFAQESVFTAQVSLLGNVVPSQERQIQAELSGLKIEEVLAEAGDLVTKGQLLARLSQESFALRRDQIEARRLTNAAAIAQAEALLIEARGAAIEAQRTAERAQTLAAQGSSPQATADTARAAAEAAEARRHSAEQSVNAARAQNALLETEIRALDLDIEKSTLRAPATGLILTRSAQLGAVTSASAPALFTLAEGPSYDVALDLTQSDLQALQKGAELTLLDGTPLRVLQQAAQVNLQDRTGRVRAALPEGPYIAGQSLPLRLLSPPITGLSLPNSALLYDGGPHVLRLSAENRAERVAVTLGARQGDWVEVRGDLAPEDRIIARAGGFLREGDAVMPIEVSQ